MFDQLANMSKVLREQNYMLKGQKEPKKINNAQEESKTEAALTERVLNTWELIEYKEASYK